MNIESKIAKITAERDECRAKSKKYADRAKELDEKLLGMVRESGLTPAELAELISLLKDNPAKAVNERTKDDENE